MRSKVSLLNFGSYAMSLRTVLNVARHSTGAVAIVEADLHSKQMKRREYTQSGTFCESSTKLMQVWLKSKIMAVVT